MNPFDVSIVICSYKSPELLRLCIESIQRNVKDITYEIIVADSATEEPTAMMMREDFPEIRFFSFKENVGFQRLVRKGLEASKANHMLILNADILVKPEALEKMLAFMHEHTEIGMLGPQLLNFNETFQESCFRFYKPYTILYRRTFLRKLGFAKRHLEWFSMQDYDHKEPKEVDWLMGSVMLVSREAVEKVGYMDPGFFMYMEDVDWCRRFWEAGYKVVY